MALALLALCLSLAAFVLPSGEQVAHVAQGNEVAGVVRLGVPAQTERLEGDAVVNVEFPAKLFRADAAPLADVIPFPDESLSRAPGRAVVGLVASGPTGVVLAGPARGEQYGVTILRTGTPPVDLRLLGHEGATADIAVLRHDGAGVRRPTERLTGVGVRGSAPMLARPLPPARRGAEAAAGLSRPSGERDTALFASLDLGARPPGRDVADGGTTGAGVRAELAGPTLQVFEHRAATGARRFGPFGWITLLHSKSDSTPLAVHLKGGA